MLTRLKRGRPNGAGRGEQVNASLSPRVDKLSILLMLKRDTGGTFTKRNAVLLFYHISAVPMSS